MTKILGIILLLSHLVECFRHGMMSVTISFASLILDR